MGLYLEGLIFGLKIKLRIYGVYSSFIWLFKVFVTYSWYKLAPILLKFKPVLS